MKLSQKLYDDGDQSKLNFLLSLKISWPIELTVTSLIDFSQTKALLWDITWFDENTCMCPIPGNKLFCYGNLQLVGIRNDPRNYRYEISGLAFVINEDFSIETLNEGPACYGSGGVFYDGSIYVFGGHVEAGVPTFMASKYNLQKNSWKRLANLPISTSFCSCTEFMGFILIGGYSNSNQSFAYDIDGNSYSEFLTDLKDYKILCKYEGCAYLLNPGGNIYESEYNNPFAWKIISKFEMNGKAYNLVHFQMVYEDFFYFVDYEYTNYYYYRFDLINKEMDNSAFV